MRTHMDEVKPILRPVTSSNIRPWLYVSFST
ncbi:hypothetical protein V1286_004975 [Bradyrhizobium algeriense]|uniref:Uncharacterized protein n=1 Tax=Bradyrhizobium algeriense TaxID=634784 RepID=A0ABU8BFW1_9BRAD